MRGSCPSNSTTGRRSLAASPSGGPHLRLDTHFAIRFTFHEMRGDTVKIGVNGTPTRSYLYAADLDMCLWNLLFDAQHGYRTR